MFDRLQRNPFLLARVFLCLMINPPITSRSIGKSQLTDSQADPVNAFYEWQLGSMDAPKQAWLVLFADVADVVLEMLAVVCDGEHAVAAGKQLEGLGDAELAIMATLDEYERRGFLTRYPHGRTIKRQCLSFCRIKSTV